MNKSVKVACLQYHAVPKEYEKNKEVIIDLLEKVATENPDIIVMPELSLNGHYYTKDKNDLSESVFGPTFEFIREYSKKLNAMIIIGINEKIEGSHLCYSTSLIVDGGELIDTYRKQHPPSVEMVFVKPSEGVNNIYKTRFGNMMLLTCYDTSFIDSYHRAFSEEVDFILVSNAWLKMEKMPYVSVEKYEHHTVLPRSIAMQTRCPIAVANMVGPTKIIVPSLPMYGNFIMEFETEFCGNSFICDHMGEVIDMMDDKSAGYVIGTIDIVVGNEMKKISIDNYGVEDMKNYIFN